MCLPSPANQFVQSGRIRRASCSSSATLEPRFQELQRSRQVSRAAFAASEQDWFLLSRPMAVQAGASFAAGSVPMRSICLACRALVSCWSVWREPCFDRAYDKAAHMPRQCMLRATDVTVGSRACKSTVAISCMEGIVTHKCQHV